MPSPGAAKSFAVEFDLVTPIILDRGIGLPGLLARIIADQGNPDPLADVPLASLDGIHAGSDLFVLGAPLDYPIAHVRSLRPNAMAHDLALRDRRRRLPMDQITLRDEYKNLFDNDRHASSAATVVAFGAGDIARVRALLDGLDHIGAKRSSGYGEIEGIRVSPIDHAHAGFADKAGNPVRSVPVGVWRGMNLPPRPVRYLVARLPRWAAAREPCVGPSEWTMEFDAYEREVAA